MELPKELPLRKAPETDLQCLVVASFVAQRFEDQILYQAALDQIAEKDKRLAELKEAIDQEIVAYKKAWDAGDESLMSTIAGLRRLTHRFLPQTK